MRPSGAPEVQNGAPEAPRETQQRPMGVQVEPKRHSGRPEEAPKSSPRALALGALLEAPGDSKRLGESAGQGTRDLDKAWETYSITSQRLKDTVLARGWKVKDEGQGRPGKSKGKDKSPKGDGNGDQAKLAIDQETVRASAVRDFPKFPRDAIGLDSWHLEET